MYAADTGGTRIGIYPATVCLRTTIFNTATADNGIIFRFEFNQDDTARVDHFSVFADGNGLSAVGFLNPDNLDTSTNSLMVHDDRSNARIWRYDYDTRVWSVVSTVYDRKGESSGIWMLRNGLGMALICSMCGPAAAMKAGV